MTTSTFADRLWWARKRAGLGAVLLSRKVGCSQSLISALERATSNGGSEYNDKFAAALDVDPNWLAHGDENKAPEGWDPAEARAGRTNMSSPRDVVGGGVVALPTAARRPFAVGPAQTLGRADELQKQMVNDAMEYTRLAGHQRAAALIEMLNHVVTFVSFEGAEGQDQVGAVEKGNDSAS